MFVETQRRTGIGLFEAKIHQGTLDRLTILFALHPQDVFHGPGRFATLRAAHLGRLHFHLATQGFEAHDGTTLHGETASAGLLNQIRTQALREGAEQRQINGAKDISHQGIESQTLLQQLRDILEQGLREIGTGVVDRIAVSWVHGNVLRVIAARAAIVLGSNDVAINQAETKVSTKDR
jgi:hypothetical protein